MIGHDGSQILWPKAHRGFHHQELIDCAVKLGFGLVDIIGEPQISSPNGETFAVFDNCTKRLLDYLANYNGILIVQMSLGHDHALAWINNKLYDPKDDSVIEPNQEFFDGIQVVRFFALVPP